MTMPVRFGNLARETAQHGSEYQEAFARVMRSGWFVLGEEGRAFESEFAAWLGMEQCVGCASGTDALSLALKALGIGPGDAVVSAANTCGPTIVGIQRAGAQVQLVDADPETLMLDARGLEAALSDATRAIVPVHLYGAAVDMDPVIDVARRHGLYVVEDCAQCHGSEYRGRKTGTFSDISAFSFYPSKNLGALGDGGACATNSRELAERLRRLRNYGQESRYTHLEQGLNSRLDEIQAAILRTKLPQLARMNRRREVIASQYREGLANCPGVVIPRLSEGARSVYQLFVILHHQRDELQAFLAARDIETYIHYPVPVHCQPAFAGLGYQPGAFPVAERMARQLLSLPMHPWLEEAEVETVVDAVREFTGRREYRQGAASAR